MGSAAVVESATALGEAAEGTVVDDEDSARFTAAAAGGVDHVVTVPFALACKRGAGEKCGDGNGQDGEELHGGLGVVSLVSCIRKAVESEV